MKLGKTSLIFLTAGIFIIVGISLVMSRSQQTDRQNQLQEDLTQANVKLAQIKLDGLIEQKDTLTRQIASYEAQTAENKALLTYSKDSIDTTHAILEEAKKQAVDIIDLTSPGISTEQLEGNPCEALSFNLRVKGNIRNIADFTCGLSNTFPTSVIKSVNMEIQPPQPAPTASPLAETLAPHAPSPAPSPTPDLQLPAKNTTVNINLVIYKYKGK